MRSNGRLQRSLAVRHLGGAMNAGSAWAEPAQTQTAISDIRLFLLTFAGGFLFTSIFIA